MEGLTLPPTRTTWPQWALDLYEERAAMMEHHGRVSPSSVEALAEADVRAVVARGGR